MSTRNVYVGGLADTTRERDLEDAFTKFGKIERVSLKYGYGFVEYSDSRDASDAVREMNGQSLDGSRLVVEFSNGGSSRRRGPPPPSSGRRGPPVRTGNRIIVDNLSSSCNWRDLKDLMRDAGVPTFADVFSDGSGVVEFERYEDMKRAISKFDETKFQGKTIYVREDRSRDRRDGGSRRRSRSPRSRSPRRRSRSPRRRSPSPRKRSASPRKRSPSPRKRSASPRAKEDSPRRRSPSPRRRSASPRRRSASPRRRSESPRRNSPSPRRENGDKGRSPSPRD